MSSSPQRRRRRRRSLRWIIFAPAATIAWLAPASAEPVEGLNAVGYVIPDTEEPQRVDDLYESCGSEVENNINRNFDGEPFQDCPSDFFMVHYSGFINFPENQQVQMMVAADDGGTIQIGDVEFGTWDLKGCSWSEIVTFTPESGSLPLDGWFYEWGGGTCYMLAWRIDDGYWEIVPDQAFTREPLTPPSTTTTSSTTTVPETTTTTTVEERATTTLPSTTTTSTTQAPPPPPPPPPPAPTTTEQETTTTTTVPETTTTLPPETTTTTLPPPLRTTTTTQPPLPTTVVETSAPSQVTVAAPPAPTVMVVVEEAATSASPVEETIPAPPADATPEQKKNFESKVDIYSGGYEDYVPEGSKISVAERRVVVAATAVLFVLPAPVPVSNRRSVK